MNLVLSPEAVVEQPPEINAHLRCEISVAIASLSIGGAERIVLEWAARIYPRWKVNLIVLRNRDQEWPVPSFIKVTRVVPLGMKVFDYKGGQHEYRMNRLREIGREIAESENPTCTCHLLQQEERAALAEGGASIITVLHNAKDGWPEGTECLSDSAQVIAVSEACATDLRDHGFKGPVSVIRHIPSKPTFAPDARETYRKAWNIPAGATVIGMVGAVKSQKNYAKAVRLIKALQSRRDAYLVIIGGPLVKNGKKDWEDVLAEIEKQGIRHRVAMPGFIANAAQCLPAFDVMLNTSHFEGLSIATLEALVSGLPVVASLVGGQGELSSEGLTLISPDASDEAWTDALVKSIEANERGNISLPSWEKFRSYRLWTLVGLARNIHASSKVLFVTANLNSGGAQRSLVNLALSSAEKNLDFSVAVAGNSTDSYFYRQLRSVGIQVERSAKSFDMFDNAEALVFKICSENIGTVCFWNLDPKLKLLVVKALSFSNVRFIDVSPGDESFHLIEGGAELQHLIAFSKEEFYGRLNRLVMKYHGHAPALCRGKTSVIQNGVPLPQRIKSNYRVGDRPRVVVNGRIHPAKFLLEILDAMKLVRKKIPGAELHVFGAAEPLHEKYAGEVFEAAKPEIGTSVFFHGANFEVMRSLPDFDAYVVLGKDQGCPNALLEALICGLPAVANDDGGTREQLIDDETGLLVRDCSPEHVAEALVRILADRKLAKRLGQTGREHVTRNFSMREMTEAYLRLFGEGAADHANQSVTSSAKQ